MTDTSDRIEELGAQIDDLYSDSVKIKEWYTEHGALIKSLQDDINAIRKRIDNVVRSASAQIQHTANSGINDNQDLKDQVDALESRMDNHFDNLMGHVADEVRHQIGKLPHSEERDMMRAIQRHEVRISDLEKFKGDIKYAVDMHGDYLCGHKADISKLEKRTEELEKRSTATAVHEAIGNMDKRICRMEHTHDKFDSLFWKAQEYIDNAQGNDAFWKDFDERRARRDELLAEIKKDYEERQARRNNDITDSEGKQYDGPEEYRIESTTNHDSAWCPNCSPTTGECRSRKCLKDDIRREPIKYLYEIERFGIVLNIKSDKPLSRQTLIDMLERGHGNV